MDESKPLGRDKDLRTATLIRDRQVRGEGHVDFLGESEGPPPPPPHDSLPDAGEAINDFWSMSGSFIYRHHVGPRVKLYSPREESFPIPLKYIDVTRTTHTNLDVKQERRIDDDWNIDGSRDLSDPWTGFTQFTLLEEKPPDGFMWSGGDWRGNSLHPGQIIYGQDSGRKWERMPSWRRSEYGRMKGSIWITHENFEESISTRRTRRSKKPLRMRVRSWKHQSLLLCLVKLWRKIVRVVDPSKVKQNLLEFWKLMNLRDCVWEESLPNHHEDHIAGKGYNSLQHYNLVHKFILIPPALKKFQQERQQWTRNGKNWRKFRRGTWRVSEVRKRWSMKQGRRAQHMSFEECWTGGRTPKSTKVELFSAVIL